MHLQYQAWHHNHRDIPVAAESMLSLIIHSPTLYIYNKYLGAANYCLFLAPVDDLQSFLYVAFNFFIFVVFFGGAYGW